MKAHWTALAVGIALGAALGWYLASAKGASMASKITGTQNAPFQAKISRG